MGLPFRFLRESMSFRDRPLRDCRRSVKERRIAFRQSSGTCRRCPGFSFSVCGCFPSKRAGRPDGAVPFFGEGGWRRRCPVFRCRRGPRGFGHGSFLRGGYCRSQRPDDGSYASRSVSGPAKGGGRFVVRPLLKPRRGRGWGRSDVCPEVFLGDGCPFRRAVGSVRRGRECAFGNGPAVGRGIRRDFRSGSAGFRRRCVFGRGTFRNGGGRCAR